MLVAARTTPFSRFAVAKSHKFFLAALLLVGGYGTALLLGSLSSWIVPQSADRAGATAPGGALVPMYSSDVSVAPLLPSSAASNSVALASQSTPREGRDVGPSSIPVTPLELPTWLAATPEPVRQETTPSDPPEPRPLAKVNDVTPWGTTASTKAASPWDRWPQWDPNSLATQEAKSANSNDARQTRASAMQASYHPADRDRDQPGDDDASGMRTHIVVDGDSLTKLADRYLDDPQQAQAIYRMNQGLLADPELLPIGVELRIPERGAAGDPLADASLQTLAASSVREPHRFEPVERWLDSGSDVPRAQLLQPVPVGRGE
jgi:hypothetical protein